MATQTTYYEFNKPAGSDLVNPLVDNNPNWDKADAALHGLSVNSIGTAVEVITLGVHALTRIDQPDAKFFTFIATGDFDAGETFTLDGVAITAALPDGSSLGTDCYVTGACVLVGLNADNTLATFYLPSTGATAPDSERLGGELPAYYATKSSVDAVIQDVTDLDNLMGNTSIASIGDGTATGAISAINADLSDTAIASLSGAGTTSFSISSSKKRLLCVVKKNNSIIESKEVPVSALVPSDVVLLGALKTIVGTNNIASNSSIDSTLVGLKLQGWKQANYNTAIQGIKADGTKASPTNDKTIGMSADMSKAIGAKLLCNSSTSFTITITDASLTVLVY